MAEKKKEKDIVGRIYNIPLRKEVRKAPKYKRANKAIRAIREFLKRHVKQDVKIGKYLNHKVLEHGRKNVPHHVEVKVTKEEKGEKEKKVEYWIAELVGAPVEKKVEEEKKGKLTKVKEKLVGKKEEKPGEPEVKSEKEKKEEVIKEKSKDLAKEKKKPKLKEGKLSTQPRKDLERRDIVVKDEKPSHERKKE